MSDEERHYANLIFDAFNVRRWEDTREAIMAATQSKARDDLPLPMDPMIAINSVLTSVPVISAGRLWDGDLLATYRRAHAQVVAAVAAGLRDAGLTDEATIDRLTAAIVERLGEGV